MTKYKQLNDEKLEKISAGEEYPGDGTFDYVSKLLKEAGDKAWGELGENNELWEMINEAERARNSTHRLNLIQSAQNELPNWKEELSEVDYVFIESKLHDAYKITYYSQILS